eukprot:3289835-Amphidinium_carterae.1
MLRIGSALALVYTLVVCALWKVAKLCRPRFVLELGAYVGYSAMNLARLHHIGALMTREFLCEPSFQKE